MSWALFLSWMLRAYQEKWRGDSSRILVGYCDKAMAARAVDCAGLGMAAGAVRAFGGRGVMAMLGFS